MLEQEKQAARVAELQKLTADWQSDPSFVERMTACAERAVDAPETLTRTEIKQIGYVALLHFMWK